jgi:hypothetical protein
MGDWIQFIIPLALAVLYVIGHIVNSYQEQARQKAPQREPTVSDEERERRGRELQRRIEAAKRRRRELEEEAQRKAEDVPYAEVEAKPVVLVDPRPALPRARKPAPAPPVVVPVVFPIHEPAPTPPPPVVRVAPAQATSTAARQVVEMLRDRKSLAAAFVLREILDAPVSRRPRVF